MVTNADFEVAERSVFGPTKPTKVNADLVYQALIAAKPGGGTAPAQGAGDNLTTAEINELNQLRKQLGRK